MPNRAVPEDKSITNRCAYDGVAQLACSVFYFWQFGHILFVYIHSTLFQSGNRAYPKTTQLSMTATLTALANSSRRFTPLACFASRGVQQNERPASDAATVR